MAPLVALHLGPLHPAEQLVTLLLAFGPFVLLGATVWWTRRRDARVAREDAATTTERGRSAEEDRDPGQAPAR